MTDDTKRDDLEPERAQERETAADVVRRLTKERPDKFMEAPKGKAFIIGGARKPRKT